MIVSHKLLTRTRYYNTIQQYLPMLPFSKKMLLANLQKCEPNLRDAFLETLYATMRSFTSVEARRDGSGSRRADNLIASFQLETSPRTMSSNLVLLHTLMLLAIETCNRAQPSPVTQPELGTLQAGQVSLCSAVGLAHMMKLHKSQLSDRFLESETDSDEKIARRTWWSLVIMDRWNASSTATPCLIPDTATVVLAEDQQLLGDITYHFARESPCHRPPPASTDNTRSVHHLRPCRYCHVAIPRPRESTCYTSGWHTAYRRT